jgi:ATP-dependent Lon protease
MFPTTRYKLLVEQVDAAERSIANLAEQQRHIHETITQRQMQHERNIAVLRDTFTSQIAQICETVDLQRSQYESLVALINDSQHRLDRLRDDLTANLTQREEQTQHHFQEIKTSLAEHRQAIEQVTHQLSTQTEHQADVLREQRKAVEALLAQHSRDVGEALQGVNQEGATDLATFNQRFEKIEANLKQLAGEEAQARKAPAQRAAALPSQRTAKQRR